MATGPNPSTIYPFPDLDRICFLKNIINHPQIEIGDYTYYDDFEDVRNFEKNVKYLFPFSGDKLIIGKFCMIASGVEFIMNGANHLSNAISSYPFEIFGNGWGHAMKDKQYPNKGNTVIGNDVWLGYSCMIMPGIKIGDGAIVATRSAVTRDVEPYTIVGGNPARPIRKRFDDATIERLLEIRWWDFAPEKLTKVVHLLTGNDVGALLAALEEI